nr:hypothetical protein [Tanacetum cinerariifolium]
ARDRKFYKLHRAGGRQFATHSPPWRRQWCGDGGGGRMMVETNVGVASIGCDGGGGCGCSGSRGGVGGHGGVMERLTRWWWQRGEVAAALVVLAAGGGAWRWWMVDLIDRATGRHFWGSPKKFAEKLFRRRRVAGDGGGRRRLPDLGEGESNRGNIKGEWRYLFPVEPQFITTCSYPTNQDFRYSDVIE